MASILDLLTDSGLNVAMVATKSGGIDTEVRDAYSALNNGASYVYMFAHNASDDLLGLFAQAEEVENGDAIILQSSNADLTVAQLRQKVWYRSSANIDPATSKTRAKITLGAVTLADNVNEDGSPVGFCIRKSA